MAWILVLGLLGAYVWYLRGGRVAAAANRVARYRRWLHRAPLAFGASSLVVLLIAGRIDALAAMPPEFAGIATTARYLAGFGGNVLALQLAILGGFGGGVLLGLAIAAWRARRGKRQLVAGRLGAFLPRNRAELGWTASIAIAAGVVEELFFRLAFPLFATIALGSAQWAVALATLLFAAAHRYQGWVGVTFSAIASVLFATVYLATGSLWFTMLVHILLNLNGMALRPALLGDRIAD
jgi:membrane protease YdiL (CAAX protease family)